MPFMTPRGLKIRFDVPFGFTLLGRLWRHDRRHDAFRVLKTCEAIEEVPSVLALIAGLIAVLMPQSPLWAIPIAIVAGKLVGYLLTQFGMFIVLQPLGLVLLARVWSYIPFWPTLIVHVPLLVWFSIAFGWLVVALWIIGYVVAFVSYWALDFRVAEWRFRQSGIPVTGSEVSFINAYRLHAAKMGVTVDVDVPDGEMSNGSWELCLADYAMKYPEAVRRFVGPALAEVLKQRQVEDLEEKEANMTRCPECGSEFELAEETQALHCPFCGADLRGAETTSPGSPEDETARTEEAVHFRCAECGEAWELPFSLARGVQTCPKCGFKPEVPEPRAEVPEPSFESRAGKRVLALLACLGIFLGYVVLAVALGWERGGGLIPIMCLLAALGAAWHGITGNRAKASRSKRNLVIALTVLGCALAASVLLGLLLNDGVVPPQSEDTASVPREAPGVHNSNNTTAKPSTPPRPRLPLPPTELATGWQRLEVSGVGTIDIPPAMEVQGSSLRKLKAALMSARHGWSEPTDVTIQQKGLNAFDPKAAKLYARVMITTQMIEDGSAGRLGDPLGVTKAHLAEMRLSIMRQAAQIPSMAIVRFDEPVLTSFNGMQAVVMRYSRRIGDNPPAAVTTYTFQNHDRIHRLTLSYREQEGAIWADYMGKIAASLRIRDASQPWEAAPGPDVQVWVERGLSHQNDGQHREAIAAYSEALRLDPNCAAACHQMGLAYAKLGQHQEAVTAYTKAVAIHPTANTYCNLASSLILSKRYGEALTACNRSLALEPNCAATYCNLGHARRGLGHYEDALRAYRTALALGTGEDEAEVRVGLGLTYQMLLRKEAAAAEYRKATELDPEGAYGRQARTFLGQMQYLESQRRAPEAERPASAPTAPPADAKAKPVQSLRAAISATRDRFAVINIGSSSGVQAGMRFAVFRQRRLIAELRITEVDTNVSGGTLSSIDAPIQVGDEAVLMRAEDSR